MSRFIIYLIEDCMENAQKTIDKLQNAAQEYEKDGVPFQLELLKGSDAQKYEEKQYVFYDQNIISEIETNVNREIDAGNKVGLLLDVMLTQEDIEESKSNYYTHASISKDIFYKFKDKIPVYIVTTSASFASYSDIIMGMKLSEQYINQNRLARDPADSLKGDFERLFTFYQNFQSEPITNEGKEKDGMQMDLVGT